LAVWADFSRCYDIIPLITMDERDTRIVLENRADPLQTQDAVRTVIETPEGRKVDFSVVLGDITKVDADAIVLPANPGFEFVPGGTLGAVAREAGMEVFNEAKEKADEFLMLNGGMRYRDSDERGVPLGHTIVTGVGRLQRPKAIIHVNNMQTDVTKPEGCDEEAVRVSAENVMRAAEEAGNIRSIAFPAIGTGLWGMELDASLKATIEGIRNHYTQNPESEIQKTSVVVYAQASRPNAVQVRSLLFNKVYPSLQNPPRK
jgi:O-acetyl-ADP-ribose deacetylase (regulator of RNase III)